MYPGKTLFTYKDYHIEMHCIINLFQKAHYKRKSSTTSTKWCTVQCFENSNVHISEIFILLFLCHFVIKLKTKPEKEETVP
jgi:hypothetical protein